MSFLFENKVLGSVPIGEDADYERREQAYAVKCAEQRELFVVDALRKQAHLKSAVAAA